MGNCLGVLGWLSFMLRVILFCTLSPLPPLKPVALSLIITFSLSGLVNGCECYGSTGIVQNFMESAPVKRKTSCDSFQNIFVLLYSSCCEYIETEQN